MNGFGIMVIVGVVLYVLLSKNKGMAACCGHSHPGASRREPDRRNQGELLRNRRRARVIVLNPEQLAQQPASGQIIDLKPEEYRVESERST